MSKRNAWWGETAFQICLHVIVFLFYAVDRQHPQIEVYECCFFGSYMLAALSINYYLLPRFFYRKSYLDFCLRLLALVVVVVVVEEFILERIFFSDTKRGQTFGGVFYVLLDVLPVIVILCGFKFGWDAMVKQRQVENLQLAVQESELQFLKSQINPHFLFNNLNNLYSYALEGSNRTSDIILELSSVLRYMLYDCRENFVPLSKEVKHLTDFVQLSEMQIEDRGRVRFQKDLKTEDWMIAPLILNVFVENAFKHSQSSMARGIIIDINLEMTAAGDLHFRCRNNYEVQSTRETVATGIGLRNVRKRLDLLYPGRHELRTEETAGWYDVSLSLQLHQSSQ